jgi:hypothetical protein
MNAIKFLLIFLMLGLHVLAAQTEQETEQERIQFQKTKVSSETIMGYTVDENGKASDIGVKKTTRLFDFRGNMNTLIEYDVKSAPVRRLVMNYNKENLIVQGFEYKGFDKLIESYKVHYENGLKTKKYGKEDSLDYEIIYRYNKNGQLIERIKQERDKTVLFKYVYQYVGNNIIEEAFWSPKMELTKKFEYNTKNQLIKETSSSQNYQGYSFIYEYDTLGNKVKETKLSTEGIPYEWFEFSYLEDKKIKTIDKYNFREMLTYSWKYMYNAKGNIEFVKIYESEKRLPVYITQYFYKYHP